MQKNNNIFCITMYAVNLTASVQYSILSILNNTVLIVNTVLWILLLKIEIYLPIESGQKATQPKESVDLIYFNNITIYYNMKV